MLSRMPACAGMKEILRVFAGREAGCEGGTPTKAGFRATDASGSCGPAKGDAFRGQGVSGQ